jgi:hypothetical protein
MPPIPPGAAPQPQANPNVQAFGQMARPQGAPPVAALTPTGAPPAFPPSAGAPAPAMAGQPAAAPAAANGQADPAALAAAGRNGDKIVAHLTPGEIAIPPQLQTPQVLAVLHQAFQAQGVNPQQFTAGSPASNVNPKTGMPEFNLWSSLLPAGLGIAGGMLAPELLPAMAPALAGAIGAGAGTMAGGLGSGQSLPQAALSGLGAGAGGYAAGSMFGGLPTQGAASTAASGNVANQATIPPAPGALNLFSAAAKNFNPAQAAGAAAGSYLGGSMAAAPKASGGDGMPSGFHDRAPDVGSLPSYAQQLGNDTYKGPTPNFSGFNPLSPTSAGWNFYR